LITLGRGGLKAGRDQQSSKLKNRGVLEERDVASFNRASEKEVLAFAEDLRQTLAKGDVKQSRLFLSSLIEKVCVGKKKVEIHYRLPVGLESSTSDLAPVLQSVTQGGAWGTECRTRSYAASW